MNTPVGTITLLMSLVLSSSLALAGAGPSGQAQCAYEGEVCDMGVAQGKERVAQSIYAVNATGPELGTKRMQPHLIKVFGWNDTTWSGDERLYNDLPEQMVHHGYPLPSSGVLIGAGERVQVRNGRIVIERMADATTRSMVAINPCALALAGGADEGAADNWPVGHGRLLVSLPSRSWMKRDAFLDLSRVDVFPAMANDKPQACRNGASDDVQSGWARSPSPSICPDCTKAANWWV
ncbi:hypothetical protein [Chitinimonas naiadis]